MTPSHLENGIQADGLSIANGARPQAFYFSSLFVFIRYRADLKMMQKVRLRLFISFHAN